MNYDNNCVFHNFVISPFQLYPCVLVGYMRTRTCFNVLFCNNEISSVQGFPSISWW